MSVPKKKPFLSGLSKSLMNLSKRLPYTLAAGASMECAKYVGEHTQIPNNYLALRVFSEVIQNVPQPLLQAFIGLVSLATPPVLEVVYKELAEEAFRDIRLATRRVAHKAHRLTKLIIGYEETAADQVWRCLRRVSAANQSHLLHHHLAVTPVHSAHRPSHHSRP